MDLSFLGGVWLMDQLRLRSYADRLERLRDWPTAERIEEAHQAAAGKQLRRAKGRVAVVQVFGIIEQRPSLMGFLFGGTSTDALADTVEALANDPEIDKIVLDVDSPGGTAYGVLEASDRIYAAGKKKQIIAVANSLAASAGFWLASSATQMVVTPGGDVGSIGAYLLHADQSKALENEGIKITLIAAGKYKVEGNWYEPLGEEARMHLQEQLNETYDNFVNAVARNRGITAREVRERYGQGRLVSAKSAREVGMVDRVETLKDVLDKLTGGEPVTSGRRASVDALRRKQAHRKRRDCEV